MEDEIRRLRAELERQRLEAVEACNGTDRPSLKWTHAGRVLGLEAAVEALDEKFPPTPKRAVPVEPGPLDEFERKRLAALRHKSSMDKLAGGVACTSVANMREREALEAREHL